MTLEWPILTRRRALKLGLAGTAGAVLSSCGGPLEPEAPLGVQQDGLPEVAPLAPGSVSRKQFADNEQLLARYLITLSALANSVEDADPETYGFITGNWWRVPFNRPFNVRVQENALTLAYFHASERSWNPYYSDEALRARLEAAITHWLRLQFDDGSFPEYRPDERSRPGTGFATAFFGALLRVVEGGPGIDGGLRARVVEALTRAVDWVLDPGNDGVWQEGRRFSNQVVVGLYGASLLLPRLEDPERDALLEDRLRYVARFMQSPAGYFYEDGGVDPGYSLTVMTPDMVNLYDETRSPVVLEMQRRYFDWLSYNQVWEPDGVGFFGNTAPSSRTSLSVLDAFRDDTFKADINALWAQFIPQAAAFVSTAEDKAAARAAWRQEDFAMLEPLGENQVEPRPIRNLPYNRFYPGRAAREAAIADLPYNRLSRFTEYRNDTTYGAQDYLFIRRPAYYLALTLGERVSSRSRYGLSFLWHPAMGMLVYSAENTATNVWSTVYEASGGVRVDANGDLPARYFLGRGDRELDPTRLGDRVPFTVRYSPPDGALQKEVFVTEGGLTVRAQAAGGLREQLPLVVLPDDELRWLGSADPAPKLGAEQKATATGFVLRRGGHDFALTWDAPLPVSFGDTGGRYFADARRARCLLTVMAQDAFEYQARLR